MFPCKMFLLSQCGGFAWPYIRFEGVMLVFPVLRCSRIIIIYILIGLYISMYVTLFGVTLSGFPIFFGASLVERKGKKDRHRINFFLT